MFFNSYLIKAYACWQQNQIIRIFTQGDPEKIIAYGEKQLISDFQRAAILVPAYKKMLAEHKVCPKVITNVQTFQQKVPIINKNTIFSSNKLDEHCVHGMLDDIKYFYTSSGFSGCYSFAGETKKSARQNGKWVDFLLDYYFKIRSKKTFLINCFPIGVKVPSNLLPMAEPGPNAETALAFIKKLGSHYEQIILVGEFLFLKKLLEDGVEQNLNWKKLTIHIIFAGEYFPESWRRYLAFLLDYDTHKKGMIIANLGISELGPSIASENPDTIKIRRLTEQYPQLHKALSNGYPCCPEILQYFPSHCYLETQTNSEGRSELLVSVLGNTKIPLFRYHTGDLAYLLNYEKMIEIIQKYTGEHFIPSFKLPFVLAYGRFKAFEGEKGGKIYPELIKDALFSNFQLASQITGVFRLLKGESTQLLIQLKKQTKPDKKNQIKKTVRQSLEQYLQVKLDVKLIPYAEYPYNLDLNFLQKIKYYEY